MGRRSHRAWLVAACVAGAWAACATGAWAAGGALGHAANGGVSPGPAGGNLLGGAGGSGLPGFSAPVTVQALTSYLRVVPGQTFDIAADVHIGDGWVYYSPRPGSTDAFPVLPGGLTVQAGRLKAGQPLWPPHKRHAYTLAGQKLVNNVYLHRAIVLVPISVPAHLSEGRYTITVQPTGQTCSADTCVNLQNPGKVQASVDVIVASAAVANPAWSKDAAILKALKANRPASQLESASPPAAAGTASGSSGAQASAPAPSQAARLTVWAGLALALLAGIILNIMPCVLPVIPLKVLSLVQHAQESRKRFASLGLAFVGGMMGFFAALAAGNVVLRLVTPGGLEWGKQFQYPPVIIAVTLVVVLVACNLLGLFTVTVRWRGGDAEKDARRQREWPHLSAAGGGVLTAFLSTPCSFGILTLALAWAQLQPMWLGTAAILVVGVGMSLPYLVLTMFPGLLSRLPKPGRWMELFKQSTGFAMLLVAVWLISTLSNDAYPMWVAAYGVVLAFCLWMWGTWVRYDDPTRRKAIVRGLAAAIALAAGWWMLPPPAPSAVRFEPFNRAAIRAAHQIGRIVLIDFTARWCLTCKAVEATVYSSPAVARKLRDLHVLVVRGDITTTDMPANEMLYRELHEPGVPVSVILPPGDSPPIRLHGLFTQSDLFAALNRAQQMGRQVRSQKSHPAARTL